MAYLDRKLNIRQHEKKEKEEKKKKEEERKKKGIVTEMIRLNVSWKLLLGCRG